MQNDLQLLEGNGMMACVVPCSYVGGSCSKMESKIVKYSWQLLDKKRCALEEESEKNELLNRLTRMEQLLAELMKK